MSKEIMWSRFTWNRVLLRTSASPTKEPRPGFLVGNAEIRQLRADANPSTNWLHKSFEAKFYSVGYQRLALVSAFILQQKWQAPSIGTQIRAVSRWVQPQIVFYRAANENQKQRRASTNASAISLKCITNHDQESILCPPFWNRTRLQCPNNYCTDS